MVRQSSDHESATCLPATRSADLLRFTGPNDRLRDGLLDTARAAGLEPAFGRVSRGTCRWDRRAERRTVGDLDRDLDRDFNRSVDIIAGLRSKSRSKLGPPAGSKLDPSCRRFATAVVGFRN